MSREKLTTALDEGYKAKLEQIAIDHNIRSKGKTDVGRTIQFLVDEWRKKDDKLGK